MIDDPHSPALPSFEMGSSHLHDYNGDWIVMVTLQRDILLIDRWTLEIEEVYHSIEQMDYEKFCKQTKNLILYLGFLTGASVSNHADTFHRHKSTNKSSEHQRKLHRGLS